MRHDTHPSHHGLEMNMLSIGAVLANYQSHLPSNWKGLRSLFPPGYTGSISLLVYYVIFLPSAFYARVRRERPRADLDRSILLGSLLVWGRWTGSVVFRVDLR